MVMVVDCGYSMVFSLATFILPTNHGRRGMKKHVAMAVFDIHVYRGVRCSFSFRKQHLQAM